MKRLSALLLAVILTACLLAACSFEQRPEALRARDVACVTASTAVFSSYLYVVEDDQAIAELVDLYNTLTYVPTDDVAFSDLLGDTLYMITYQRRSIYSSTADSPLASVWISPQGYVHFTDYEAEEDPDADLPVYRLTNDFDEERLKALLEENNTFQ